MDFMVKMDLLERQIESVLQITAKVASPEQMSLILKAIPDLEQQGRSKPLEVKRKRIR
eukprot:CAMPEP_0185574094 /NCGR_PEP_ID=MMETSP0434-20130131/5647_1 /TAXON_ID=626734 ORGANISM="Favella taraikaensis, Strain Fe Narragansett Bay" /NCGR_SAMPLE_ID=MMETSP0434 /ASSEMBLY_ACC=CAM_ASM_000379 /LENGTH=57 /DNA_ID=CAMNT_0028190553 /DNA_START=1240 /DNA_END=1413 /DNA_ORIENTATION=-